jgi:4-carboxymuconolactone decarboxylase
VAENLAGRRERGLEIYRQMGWGNNQDLKDLDEDLWSLTTDFVFGEVWSRPGLTLREREIAVLSALIALGTEGMDLHLRYAHKLGISNDEIRELIFQVMYYVGQPRGLFAMKRLKAVMAEGSGRKKRPSTKRDKRRR